MSTLQYSQTSYYDSTASASCVGSALFITSVGTGCSSSVAGNSNSHMCLPATGDAGYAWYDTSCSDSPIDFQSSVRTYLVKSSFTSSSTCEGKPLQAMAVAADAMCHSSPGSTPPQWFKANCNGGQPIWNTCSDAGCTNCTTTRYTADQCQLTGAGASESMTCFMAKKSTNTSTSTSSTTASSSNSFASPTGDLTAFGSSAERNVDTVVSTTWKLVAASIIFGWLLVA